MAEASPDAIEERLEQQVRALAARAGPYRSSRWLVVVIVVVFLAAMAYLVWSNLALGNQVASLSGRLHEQAQIIKVLSTPPAQSPVATAPASSTSSPSTVVTIPVYAPPTIVRVPYPVPIAPVTTPPIPVTPVTTPPVPPVTTPPVTIPLLPPLVSDLLGASASTQGQSATTRRSHAVGHHHIIRPHPGR